MFNRLSSTLFILSVVGSTTLVGCTALISNSIANTNSDTELTDYDCSFALSAGVQSIQSLTLTEDVYRCFRLNNYADIAVVNADKDPVPFTMKAPAVQVSREHYTQDIRFYQEPNASSYRTGDQLKRIVALTGAVSSRVNGRQWQDTNTHYSSVILEQPPRDNDQLGDKLVDIALDVKTSEKPIRTTVLVEVSDDLQNWQTRSTPHDFYFLPGKDGDLNHNRLKLSRYLNRDAKYVRLAMLSTVASFTTLINRIVGTYEHTGRSAPPMQWTSVEPYKLEAEQGIWQFDLPSLLPVSALRLNNADNIVFYQGQVFAELSNNLGSDDRRRKSGKKKLEQALKNAAKGKSRNSESVKWRTVTGFNRYKLVLEKGSIESADIRFATMKSRAWKIQFSAPTDLRAAQLPTIELGWLPSTFSFVAQGEGPFRLMVGRNHAPQKIGFPNQLLALSESAEAVELLGGVALDDDNRLDNAEHTLENNNLAQDDTQWGAVLLWALLLLGVGLMLFMAYRLMRAMKTGNTE